VMLVSSPVLLVNVYSLAQQLSSKLDTYYSLTGRFLDQKVEAKSLLVEGQHLRPQSAISSDFRMAKQKVLGLMDNKRVVGS